jgi:hypothetical protein
VDQTVEARIIDGLLTREADILLLAKHYAKALPERFMQVRIIRGTKVLKLVVLNYLLAKHYAKTLSERFMQVRIICGTKLLTLVGTSVLIFESSQHAARVSSLSGQYASRSSGAGGGVYEAAAVGQQERVRSTEETDSPHTYDAVVIGIRWRMQAYAGAGLAGLSAYVYVCCRMLTYAAVCCRMLTYADVC